MSTPVTMEVTKLDYEESNAPRYCAGYILRSVRKKIDKSAHDHPMKKALQLCVQDLYESIIITIILMQALFIFVDEAVTETGSEDQSTSQHEASQWLETVNRGGLVIVSDIVYDLFLQSSWS